MNNYSSEIRYFRLICHLAIWKAAISSSPGNDFFRKHSWLGRRYQTTDEDWQTHSSTSSSSERDRGLDKDSYSPAATYPLRIVSGREFDLFDSTRTTKGAKRENIKRQEQSTEEIASRTEHDLPGTQDSFWHENTRERSRHATHHVRFASTSSSAAPGGGFSYRKFSEYERSTAASPGSGFFLIPPPVAEWWTANVSPNIKNLPRLQCRLEPTTTLKIRKTFRPLKTIVQLGADFNTQLGVWVRTFRTLCEELRPRKHALLSHKRLFFFNPKQHDVHVQQFKSSWEDAIIGGKLTLAGRELQLTKSWQLSVGAVEDLVTRLRLRAAVDLQTWKAYVRVGFRTERLAPINVMEGFTMMKQVPLDGTAGHVKLEVKANVALPEPEIEYSTETQRSLIGMGNIEVSIEELNLVLDY